MFVDFTNCCSRFCVVTWLRLCLFC